MRNGEVDLAAEWLMKSPIRHPEIWSSFNIKVCSSRERGPLDGFSSRFD